MSPASSQKIDSSPRCHGPRCIRRSIVSAGFCLIVILAAAGCRKKKLPEGFLGAWGAEGVVAGSFVKPRGLAVGADGEVYCVDMTGRVQAFSPDGVYRASWMLPETKIGLPEGLAVDREGRLLVADTHYNRVLCFARSFDGQIAFSFGQEGTGPGEFTYPLAVAVAPDGSIFVAEYGGRNDRVQKFSPQGRYLTGWGSFGEGPGQFQRPSGIACDSKGFVYVADAVNHRVQKFDADGRLVGIFGSSGKDWSALGQLHYPYDVAVGPGDSVYVVEYGGDRLQRLTATGDPVAVWGRPGSKFGELFDPWCIAVNRRGEVYVADTGNHRIQRLKFGRSRTAFFARSRAEMPRNLADSRQPTAPPARQRVREGAVPP